MPCQTPLPPDLAAADIPYQNATGEYADFQSLRHSYITRLLRSGVSVPVTQRLARHKTPISRSRSTPMSIRMSSGRPSEPPSAQPQ